MLDFFNVWLETVGMAGGISLFLIALKMMSPG